VDVKLCKNLMGNNSTLIQNMELTINSVSCGSK